MDRSIFQSDEKYLVGFLVSLFRGKLQKCHGPEGRLAVLIRRGLEQKFHLMGSNIHCNWGRMIWKAQIPPSRVLVCWRMLLNRLPTDDLLQRCGISLSSVCAHCQQSEETISHLMLQCPFAQALWTGIGGYFGIVLDTSTTILRLLDFAEENSFGKLLKGLIMAGVLTGFWSLWLSRNVVRFDDQAASIHLCLRRVWRGIYEAAAVSVGAYGFRPEEEMILRKFYIAPQRFTRTKDVFFRWIPPVEGWLKVNTDGSCLASSGKGAAAGVFRDFKGSKVGCFVDPIS